MSNNNPFFVNDANFSTPFITEGIYTLRIISMKCWTHTSDGEEHVLPTMGLILGLDGDKRQVKVTLTCPEREEGHERFATKLGHIILAAGMQVEDFYIPRTEDSEGKAGPALEYVRGGENHPRCPVGKTLKVKVAPDFFFVRNRAGEIVTPEFAAANPQRALKAMEFWNNDRLCCATGYYSLREVFKS